MRFYVPALPSDFWKKAFILALVLTLLIVSGRFPQRVLAESILVKPIVTDSMSWAPRDVSQDTDTTFHFDSTDRFGGLTDVQVASNDLAAATASLSGNVVAIEVKSLGKPVFTLSGTDGNGNLVTDRFQADITKIGDLTGDGKITSSDSLFITRYLSGKVTVSDDEKLIMDINGDGQVTKEDAVELTNVYVRGSGTGQTIYFATFREVNDAPVARNVRLSGTVGIGQQLSGVYEYFDVEKTPEGGSQWQWYSGSQADGSDKEAIVGATAAAYTVRAEDVGKYLFVGVTPVGSDGQAGEEAMSDASAKIAAETDIAVSSLTPANGATDVSAQLATLTISFNQEVTASDKLIHIRRYADDIAIATYAANDAAQVTVSGSEVTVHVAGLQENASYYVTIEAGAFVNAGNKSFAGFSDKNSWTFATGDETAPEISAYTPAPNSTEVDPALASIRATFSENVTPVSGKYVTIRKASDQSEVAKYDAADAQHVTVANQEATILLPALAEGTGYYVEIEAGAFADSAGNPFAGISGGGAWAFATAAATINVTVSAASTPASLTENNLEGAVIELTLTGDSLKGTASAADFQLNNPPSGLMVKTAYVQAGKAYLVLKHQWSPFSGDVTGFSVTVKASAMTGGQADATTNAMTIRAMPQTLSPFFSEYVDGLNGRGAVEIWYLGDGDPSHKAEGYSVEIQKYMKNTNTVQVESISLYPFWPQTPYIIIDQMFYDFFDVTPAQYYNTEAPLSSYTGDFVVTAILLKKGSQVIDVLGTPNATSATPILPSGGTLVRRSGTIGGMDSFGLSHWDKYPVGTFQYIGTHTP